MRQCQLQIVSEVEYVNEDKPKITDVYIRLGSSFVPPGH